MILKTKKSNIMNHYLFLIWILFPLLSSGQTSRDSETWANKAKQGFYKNQSYQEKSINDKKVIDCLFNKTSNKFTSFERAMKYVKHSPEIAETFQLLISVPLIGRLTVDEEKIIHKEMLILVNKFRQEKLDNEILEHDPDLDIASKIQSDYCAKTNELSHLQKGNVKYSNPAKRVAMVKTGSSDGLYNVGENVIYVRIDYEKINNPKYLKVLALEMFEDWKASERHRDNMLNKDFKYFGFAVTVNADSEIIYAIQVFKGD